MSCKHEQLLLSIVTAPNKKFYFLIITQQFTKVQLMKMVIKILKFSLQIMETRSR